MPSFRRVMMVCAAALLASTAAAPAMAEEPEVVEAAVLSIMPEDYDGKRIQTEMSVATPIGGRPKRVGCEKDDIPYMLTGSMAPAVEGGAPTVLRGSWVLCTPRASAAEVATAGMGAIISFRADVEVKGPKHSPRVKMHGVEIISITPLTTQ